MVKPVPIREMCLRVLSRQPSEAEFAAHTIIASMLFNLYEALGYLDDYVWDGKRKHGFPRSIDRSLRQREAD